MAENSTEMADWISSYCSDSQVLPAADNMSKTDVTDMLNKFQLLRISLCQILVAYQKMN